MVNVLLSESNAYKNFINTVDAEATKQSYRFAFSKFMKFYSVEDYDYEKMLQIEQKKLEGLIRDYVTHLKVDKELSYNSINLHFAAISHFYQMNGVSLNWKLLTKFKGTNKTTA